LNDTIRSPCEADPYAIREVKSVTEALKALLEAAKKARPSSEQREEQRRSFAYGNTAFENPLITREMVDRQAELLAQESDREPDGQEG
jgi:hypothetical protein